MTCHSASSYLDHLSLLSVWVYMLAFCTQLAMASSHPHAIVVGAGPAGLATALVLARNHGYRVTVIEKYTKEMYSDPNRAYTYAINFRGQTLTQKFPEIHAALQEQGVASECFSVKRVPGDPDQLFDNKTKTVPLNMGVYYHIARHLFSMILADALEKEKGVELLWGRELYNMGPEANGTGIEAFIQTIKSATNTEVVKYTASLVIGADGMNSKVRDILSQSSSPFSSWTKPHNKFKVKHWKSPAYGLRCKVSGAFSL
jgi:2-polyprenyl-6-methoxyphenol hydroxylase-like FAD-dependent oxidoreductase